MFHWLAIKRPDDFEGLNGLLPVTEFGLGEVIAWLKSNLSGEVGGVLVEHPYIDKDYRSTYYHYYAKKGLSYSPQAARLHLFKRGWTLDEASSTLSQPAESTNPSDEMVRGGYLGFVGLRPTRINTLGRTVVHPKALKNSSGRLIEHEHKAHVFGYRIGVKGFPFMQQHSDIAVCAHTACWAILRHYSERYSLYREILVHDISKLGREFDPGGLLPSLGITARDAQRIFAAVGSYPLMQTRPSEEPDVPQPCRFEDELLAYIESGFPLFGVQTGRAHAVAIVGYRRSDDRVATGQETRHRAWDFVSHLVVVDDNHRPYLPVGRAPTLELDYTVDAFDAFIVPLPEKMFLPAAAAFKFADELREAPPDEFLELGEDAELITRAFVTTTASWQRFVRGQAPSLPSDFVTVALELTMPQFIWVVEFARPAQRRDRQVQARLLIDATAGHRDPFPVFLLHDQKGALWVDRANRLPMGYQPFDKAVAALSEMDSNLVEH